MDIVAHGLWAALLCRWRGRERPMRRTTAAWTVGLAVAPDLVQLTPIAIGALVLPEGWTAMQAYFHALPRYQTVLPPLVETLMHHLHCTMHSAVVAIAVTFIVLKWKGHFWWPLAGWWLHIGIDVFTHSAAFYPSPVFYPFTQAGFDGLAWNTPWFMWLNYTTIALVWLWQTYTRPTERNVDA